MAEKGMFVKFMSAFKKHIKTHYPFVKQLEKSLDASIPKNSSFYLGVSPNYNKHVIINFLHESKPWRVGQFSVYVHISNEYKLVDSFDPRYEEFDRFGDGLFNISIAFTGRNRTWCLNPTDRTDDNLWTYWQPTSYDSDEVVIKEAIADVCVLLEKLFVKGGFM